jgi:biopolymer transport protein ExbB
MYRVLITGNVLLTGGLLWAQEAAGEAGEAAPAAAEPAAAEAAGEVAMRGPGFIDIVYGGSIVNLLIWLMIAATSFATVWFIVDAIITIKREKLIPPDVVDGVRDALSEGDLGTALETCEANPGSLSIILMAGFSNISEGYDIIQESVASSAEMESEKLMQRVNYLNLCGQIAPMLGLMGTVTGMVAAFGGLAGATGAAKAQILAQSISTALWTTCVGLIISVPALLAFTLIRNYATRLILESEATVLDLIKVLRNAEIEDEDEDY